MTTPDQLKDLVAQIVAVLIPAVPYLKLAATSAASEVGKDSWRKAKELFQKLRARFQQDNNTPAQQTLDLFIDNPTTFEEAIAKLLLQTLEAHPEWAQEVQALLNEGPLQEIIARNNSTLERVRQSISGARGTQRIELDNSKGTRITQEIKS